MNIGIGDAAVDCGVDPCGLWDYVYASDACAQYKLCSGQWSPTDPRVIGLLGSAATGVAADVGSAAAAGVGAAATGLANSTSFGGFMVLGLIGLAIYAVKR